MFSLSSAESRKNPMAPLTGHQAPFFWMTVQRKCKWAQSQACLSYAECSLSYYAVQRYRLSSDTTKFRVAIRTDFQQLLILNSVNKTNSYFSKKENIVLLRKKLWVLTSNNHNNSYHSFSNHFSKSQPKTNYRYNI